MHFNKKKAEFWKFKHNIFKNLVPQFESKLNFLQENLKKNRPEFFCYLDHIFSKSNLSKSIVKITKVHDQDEDI